MAKKKKYIPNSKYNPALLSKRIDNLSKDVEHHKNLLISVNKANDLHVEHLSNFVRHDMKNAILGLDSILYNASNDGQIDYRLKEELDTVIKLLWNTLDNFSKLIPTTSENNTKLPDILNAVEMLSRGELNKNKIFYQFEYDRNSEVIINCSFQSLVQVIHNLLINAINALSNSKDKKILVKGTITNDLCKIYVYDNGFPIDIQKSDLIFNYGYSTTGGTGVGLFHAKSVVEKIGGSITVVEDNTQGFTKVFIITFNPQISNYE